MSTLLSILFLLEYFQVIQSQYVNITCQDSPLNTYPYCNSKLPIDQRVDDLLSRLTLWEKVFMQNSDQGGVPRLGVPTLGHSECNRGTGTSQKPSDCAIPFKQSDFPLTAFPQAINLAGAFSRDLMAKMARAISNEVRAKFNTALKFGCNNDNGFGIACWAPMIVKKTLYTLLQCVRYVQIMYIRISKTPERNEMRIRIFDIYLTVQFQNPQLWTLDHIV